MVSRFITDERCSGSSPSGPSTPGAAAACAGRLRGDRHGTPSPACTSRAAGCERSPKRWRPPPPTPVQFRYNASVTRLEQSGSRVTAVCTDNGDRIACDAVVLTTELPLTYQLLGRTHAVRSRCGPPRRRCSCVRCPAQQLRAGSGLQHHNISFGGKWSGDLRRDHPRRRADDDPSILVTMPTAGDPSLAPGRSRPALRVGAMPESRSGQGQLGRPGRQLRP